MTPTIRYVSKERCYKLILFCKVIIVTFTYIWKVIDMCNRSIPEKLWVLNYIVKYKILVVLPSVIKGTLSVVWWSCFCVFLKETMLCVKVGLPGWGNKTYVCGRVSNKGKSEPLKLLLEIFPLLREITHTLGQINRSYRLVKIGSKL